LSTLHSYVPPLLLQAGRHLDYSTDKDKRHSRVRKGDLSGTVFNTYYKET